MGTCRETTKYYLYGAQEVVVPFTISWPTNNHPAQGTQESTFGTLGVLKLKDPKNLVCLKNIPNFINFNLF